jgi:GAF domain-containing protein
LHPIRLHRLRRVNHLRLHLTLEVRLIHIDFDSPAELPANEVERQSAVERSGVLKRRNDSGLQGIVDQAAKIFDTAIAAVTIIDGSRQWFAARLGDIAEETPREISFCAHAILRPGEPLVVPDARHDRRFANNPLVLFAPRIRFYAGVPLIDRQGYPLGALCVIDTRPRDEPPNLFELSLLAREVERLIVR